MNSISFQCHELRVEEELYRQAIVLRHVIFFQPHGIGRELVVDRFETNSRHFALAVDDVLIAYGRLTQIANRRFKVSQMLTHPGFRRRGHGTNLLQFILDVCSKTGGEIVELEARINMISFYQRLGFRIFGDPYPSRRTKVIHVHMEKSV